MERKRAWVVALTGVGSLMAALDTLVVAIALSTIRTDLDASVAQLEWTVNAYNLSFAVLLMTAAALGDRFGRRRFYAAGVALFTRRVGGLRARPRHRLADRRPRAAGHRRGVRDAARPRAPERRLPARAARRGDRHLQRHHRARRGQRAARRRRGRRGHRLDLDLLAQRPDRPARRPARAGADGREPRRAHPARPPRAGARDGRRARARVGAGARQPRRLGERGGGRVAGRRDRAGRRLRRLGAARARADAADELLPLARLLGRQRGDLLRLRLAVLGRVLLLPAAPDRARLRRARRRAAAAAVDRDVPRDRARSPARSPTGSASGR